MRSCLSSRRTSGHTVERWDATAGKVRDRMLEGAQADVGFITGSVIADVEKAGRIVPESKVAFARSALGVAVRKGAAKPDLSSEDAIKRLILGAKTIALTDPEGGGNTGRYFMGVADRLGVGAELRAQDEALSPRRACVGGRRGRRSGFRHHGDQRDRADRRRRSRRCAARQHPERIDHVRCHFVGCSRSPTPGVR